MPLQQSRVEEYPSGTSSAVGPSFFAGQDTQNTDVHRNRNVHTSPHMLLKLGWTLLGTAALLFFAGLEWWTWRSPTSPVGSDTVTTARSSAPGAIQAEPQPHATKISTTLAPDRPRAVTVSAINTQPALLDSADVATLPRASAVQNGGSADNEAVEQQEPAGDSAKVKLLRAAMGRGDADAFVNLANLYLEGREVSRSCDEAVRLLESAAAKPNARARNRLAAMYEIGTCVQRDRVQAYRWLSSALAADSNNSWAQQNRDATWRQMTSEERTMAQAYR